MMIYSENWTGVFCHKIAKNSLRELKKLIKIPVINIKILKAPFLLCQCSWLTLRLSYDFVVSLSFYSGTFYTNETYLLLCGLIHFVHCHPETK